MAYDEDPENPGMAELTINVAPPDRNALEELTLCLLARMQIHWRR